MEPTFADKLRAALAKSGQSQSDIARRAWGSTKETRGYDVARNRDYIGRYLKGAYPTPENLELLAAALDVAVDELACPPPDKPLATKRRVSQKTATPPYELPPPSWQPRWLACLKCKQKWLGWIAIRVPIAVAAASMKAAKCQNCGAGSRQITFDIARELEGPPE